MAAARNSPSSRRPDAAASGRPSEPVKPSVPARSRCTLRVPPHHHQRAGEGLDSLSGLPTGSAMGRWLSLLQLPRGGREESDRHARGREREVESEGRKVESIQAVPGEVGDLAKHRRGLRQKLRRRSPRSRTRTPKNVNSTTGLALARRHPVWIMGEVEPQGRVGLPRETEKVGIVEIDMDARLGEELVRADRRRHPRRGSVDTPRNSVTRRSFTWFGPARSNAGSGGAAPLLIPGSHHVDSVTGGRRARRQHRRMQPLSANALLTGTRIGLDSNGRIARSAGVIRAHIDLPGQRPVTPPGCSPEQRAC